MNRRQAVVDDPSFPSRKLKRVHAARTAGRLHLHNSRTMVGLPSTLNESMSTPARLASCRIFIIHEDPVLGSTLASACEHRGARIVGIHRSAEQALQALAFHALAHHGDLIAILDSRVDDAARVAHALADRGVPYLVIVDSGDGAGADLGGATTLTAPVPRGALMEAVTALCTGGDRG